MVVQNFFANGILLIIDECTKLINYACSLSAHVFYKQFTYHISIYVVKIFLPIQIVTIIETKTSKAAEQSFKLSNWIHGSLPLPSPLKEEN